MHGWKHLPSLADCIAMLPAKWAGSAQQKPLGKLDLHLCLERYMNIKTFGASASGVIGRPGFCKNHKGPQLCVMGPVDLGSGRNANRLIRRPDAACLTDWGQGRLPLSCDAHAPCRRHATSVLNFAKPQRRCALSHNAYCPLPVQSGSKH